jgi:hypothetical protein
MWISLTVLMVVIMVLYSFGISQEKKQGAKGVQKWNG